MTPSPPAARSSRRPLLIAAGCAVLLACAVVVAAGAGLYFLRARGQASQPTVEYILDASPRMAQPDSGGTRLSVAQGVLAEIVRPADSKVTAGLRVFGTGHLVQTCQDTDLLVPLAPASQGAISDNLAAIQGGAGVDAAMGQAMVAAIRDLAATRGPHSLVVVTGGADSCNPEAGQLIASEAARAGIKLQLFVVGYQVSDADAAAIQGVVDQTTDATYLNALTPDDLRRTLEAIQARVDNPNSISIANVVGTAGAAAGTAAPTGPTGQLQVSVLAYAGQPAEGGGRLTVQAFAPQDHQTLLATDYKSPAVLDLPSGAYDIYISYFVAERSPFVGGWTERWITGVQVEPGQTVTRSLDLALGQVNLSFFEAAGQPAPNDNYGFAFRVYPVAAHNITETAATVIVTNTAVLQLAAGSYRVEADVPGTEYIKLDQSAQTFQVTAGQTVDYALDLKLGHARIEVDDDAGQPIDPAGVIAFAYLAGQTDPQFAYSFNANPADLALLAETSYDIQLKLADNRTLWLTNQQLQEGQILTLQVNQRDFK